MKINRTIYSIILFLLFPLHHAYNQNLIKYSSTIDIKSIEGLVSFLSDDLTEGRGIGTYGHQLAESLIMSKFDENSLIPFYHNTYTQSFRIDTLIGRNIIGVVRAQYYSDKYIVVSAHYDHLGIIGGRIFNGADDNASGVAVLLNLARLFSLMRENREGLRKNIIFAAFDGKENNLAGSEDFLKKLPVNKKDIVCNINIDQIGCTFAPPGKNPDYLLVLGAGSHKDFRRLIEKASNEAGLLTDINYDFYGSKQFADIFYSSSDQYSFSRRGIPSLLITSGVHMHTYKPTDDKYFINYPILVNRTRLIFNFIYQVSLSL